MKNFIRILPIVILFISCSGNEAPQCLIISPAADYSILKGDSVLIQVEAMDSDGSIIEVRLGINDIGLISLKEAPYKFTFASADYEPAPYRLTAEAIDNKEASSYDTILIYIKSLPIVETLEATNVTAGSVYLNASINYDGNEDITDAGFYIANSDDPFTEGDKIATDSIRNNFNVKLAELDPSTEYYFLAYAVNSAGESVGEVRSFTTLLPTQTGTHSWR